MNRHGVTVFCDDIRREAGNKLSYMGCYSSALQVDRLPSQMPRLGLFTVLDTPAARPFGSVTLRVYVPGSDKPFAETTQSDIPRPATDGPSDPERMMRVNFSLILTDVPLACPGFIRVRALCDDEVIRCGALGVQGPEGGGSG
jgi:hypothetical protein